MKDFVSWKIGGEAGFGIMASGTMLGKAFSRNGYHIIAANEYPSLIRGGHNVITVGISTLPFHALPATLDILVALNKETVDIHNKELHEGSIVVFDPKDVSLEESEKNPGVHYVPLPMGEIIAEKNGNSLMRNTIAVGATIALLGKDISYLTDVITSQFIKKGQSVVDENIYFAQAGYNVIASGFQKLDEFHLKDVSEVTPLLVMNASEAVGIGAIDGGMKFAAIYPMTPINALINLFADNKTDLQVSYVQPEDEIAGINMAIGASIGGVRSMVATSGGGFALMVEGLSLAGITEVPLVIDLGMRPGPATGMPTYTEQGELFMAMFAGHGEFPRIILAPGDVEECYRLSKRAFDLAQKYQVPVFILTDKYLNENQWSVEKEVFDKPAAPVLGQFYDGAQEGFKRYDLSATNGVSPRSVPGQKGGIFLTNSYEHDEVGLTTEDSSMRVNMANKRMKKHHFIIEESDMPTRYGDQESDVTFVCFGSVKGPVLEAMRLLSKKGMRSACIHFSWVYPIDGRKLTGLLLKEKRLVAVEGNSSGQLSKYIRMETGIEIVEKYLKYDGRQVTPEELAERF